MGYTLHIRRPKGSITLEEWLAFARSDRDLEEAALSARDLDEKAPGFQWHGAMLVWKGGEISVDDLDDEWCKKLGEIASRLGAEAVGDDGEKYLPDGRVDYGDGAQTLHKISTMAALKDVRVEETGPRRPPVAAIVVAILALAGLAYLLTR